MSKVAVWRWQERFMTSGVEGLLRDKSRPSRIPPLGAEVAARVVTLTTTMWLVKTGMLPATLR